MRAARQGNVDAGCLWKFSIGAPAGVRTAEGGGSTFIFARLQRVWEPAGNLRGIRKAPPSGANTQVRPYPKYFIGSQAGTWNRKKSRQASA